MTAPPPVIPQQYSSATLLSLRLHYRTAKFCGRFKNIISIFLGAFAKLRTANVGIIMSIGPSSWINSAPAERNFMKYDI
jgi:hypothetical protein